MFETILAPLDGSKLAEQAIPYVTALAEKFDSIVTLMGICESEETEEGETCRISIDNQVEKLQSAVSPSHSIFRSVVLAGHPAQQIIDYAEKNKAGLIVLTSHGSSGLAPWSIGSTVQKILHLRSTVPLLLIKAVASTVPCENLFGRILLPLDGSTRGEAAIPYIIEVTRKFESDVILFHVVEEGRHTRTIGGLDYIRFRDQDISTAKTKAEQYLNDIGTKFAGTKARLIHEVRVGEAAREILQIAKEQERCMIAMASHGHSGIDAWTFGSVAYKISQSVDKPLLLVRA